MSYFPPHLQHITTLHYLVKKHNIKNTEILAYHCFALLLTKLTRLT